MIELGLNVGFAAKPGFQMRLRRRSKVSEQDGFNHNFARQIDVLPAINRSHAAVSQFAGDSIIAYDSADHSLPT